MAHPNADLMRKAFEAASASDITAMVEMIADDAKWHVPGTSALAGDYEGKEEILTRWFGPAMPEGMTSWQSELHAVLADDDHTVALIRNTVSRGGETFQLDTVFVAHVAGGKVTEAWVTPVDLAVFEAVWT